MYYLGICEYSSTSLTDSTHSTQTSTYQPPPPPYPNTHTDTCIVYMAYPPHTHTLLVNKATTHAPPDTYSPTHTDSLTLW